VDAVCRDYRTAPLSEKDRALFHYLARLNDAPATLEQSDADALAAAGWGNDAVYDAVTVCALFNFFNRWIDGTGVPDVPRHFYEERLSRMGDMQYAPTAPAAPPSS
jgi:alkylhydroperoxidase family enzyme